MQVVQQLSLHVVGSERALQEAVLVCQVCQLPSCSQNSVPVPAHLDMNNAY